MLEQCKIGILGSGRLRQWFIDKSFDLEALDRSLLTRKLIDEKLLYKIIILTPLNNNAENIHICKQSQVNNNSILE
jgi:hypothetical protein